MILAGIDYGYTSPSICIYNTNDTLDFLNLKFFNLTDKKRVVGVYDNIQIANFPDYSTQEERFRNIASWASNVLSSNVVNEACIEGYSFGASSGLVFQIAENTSLIKQYMNMNGIPFTSTPPSQVKRNFTGKGNAKKPDMVDMFHNTFPGYVLHDILKVNPMAKPIDDLCDAYAILQCHSHFNFER